MIKNNEFTELCLFIDSREQTNAKNGKTRVKRIMDWFLSHGGSIDMIEIRALPLCDIAICGGFDTETKTFLPGLLRGKEICLGIEYKTIADFSGSNPDLNWKLIDSYLHYKQVALFIEEGDITLSYVDGQTYVRNTAVPGGAADILLYEHMKNQIDRFSRIAEIHVRTFPYENFIDANLDSLLVMVAEEPKVPMYCRGKDVDQEKVAFINSLLYIPKIGVSTAMKFTNYYPNWEIMAERASYAGEYESIAGILTGKRVRDFVQMGSEKNKKICSRKNECFENRKTLKIPIELPLEEQYESMDKEQKIAVANEIWEYLIQFYPDGKTPLEVCEHFDCQGEYIKDILICIKRMAENGRITSTIKGIFIAVPNPSYTQDTILTIPPIQSCDNTSGEIPDVQITLPMTLETAPNEDKAQSLSGKCPLPDSTDTVEDITSSRGCALTLDNTPKSIQHKEVAISIVPKDVVIYPDTHSVSQSSSSELIISLAGVSHPVVSPLVTPDTLQSQSNTQPDINSESPCITPDISGLAASAGEPHLSPNATPVLQSPQIITTPPILCGDEVGGNTPLPTTFIPKPVIHTLDDIIVDFCYEKPKADFSIISYCQSKGHTLPEIHKALSGLSKTKLHRYKEKGMEMYSYKLLKADKEFDIGID